jgi:hypothetical protein
MRLAGNFLRGNVGILLGRWVGGEPGLLLFDEASGLFAYVADGFEGQFAGETVGGVFRWLFEVGGPALGGVEEFGQGFANVAMVGAVVVKVVVELVGDCSELLEKVVSIFFATGLAGVSEEILDRLVSGVEELDEDEDAIVGEVGRFAELLDFTFGEGGVAALCVKGQNESEEN